MRKFSLTINLIFTLLCQTLTALLSSTSISNHFNQETFSMTCNQLLTHQSKSKTPKIGNLKIGTKEKPFPTPMPPNPTTGMKTHPNKLSIQQLKCQLIGWKMNLKPLMTQMPPNLT